MAIFIVLALSGCGRKKPSTQPQSAVSRFQTTPLPVPPPAPDPLPTNQDIAGAKSDIEIAQTNVEQVLKIAETTPAAQPAVAPLTTADAHMTSALTKLADALAHNTKVTEAIAAKQAFTDQAQRGMQGDIEKLKKLAGSDADNARKTITALESENDDLRNEALRSARNRLMWTGVLLIVGGIGSFAASVYLGFLAGPKLAMFMGFGGVILIGLSQLLQKIAFWSEVACVVGALVLCVWLVWHAFHHDPIKPGIPAGGAK